MTALRTPVLWLCFAMVIGMMGAALISPLYPIYKSQWHLQASDISLTYVIYMLGALCSLLVFGRLPDRLSPFWLLLLSLVISAVATLITMLAQTTQTLFVGRFLVGLASSLSYSAGGSALSLHLPKAPRQRVSLIFSLIIALGFGAGPLLGGMMGQFSASPLTSTYIPMVVLCVVAVLGLLLFVRGKGAPEPRKPLQLTDLLPRLTFPASGLRLNFLLTSFSAFLAFGIFGLYASMVPLFIDKMMHMKGPLVSAVSIAGILAVSSLMQILLQRLSGLRNLQIGLIAMMLSNLALLANLYLGSAPIFICGVMAAALSHGASMLGSMSLITQGSPAENRAGLTATYMVVGYLGAVLSVLGLGWGADHLGLDAAVAGFCIVVIVLSLILFVLNLTVRRAPAL